MAQTAMVQIATELTFEEYAAAREALYQAMINCRGWSPKRQTYVIKPGMSPRFRVILSALRKITGEDWAAHGNSPEALDGETLRD